MKHLITAFVMATLVALAVSARAWAPPNQDQGGYSNADMNGGYGCNLAGTLGGAGVVGTAEYHPYGNGTFIESLLTLQIGGIGVCQYALESGMGTYDITVHGTGSAHLVYSRVAGSATGCPSTFDSHLSFVCSGASVTANTCDIATLDIGVLLSGTCKKQNKYK